MKFKGFNETQSSHFSTVSTLFYNYRVYFIYQTRGNYNPVEFLDFQYHDVVLQETQEVAGLISDAISTFNKTVTINDDLYVMVILIPQAQRLQVITD